MLAKTPSLASGLDRSVTMAQTKAWMTPHVRKTMVVVWVVG